MCDTSRLAEAVIQALTNATEGDRGRVWRAIYDYEEGLGDGIEDVLAKVRGTFVEERNVYRWQRNSLGTLEQVLTRTEMREYA